MSISAVDVDGLYEAIVGFFDKILLFVDVIFNVGELVLNSIFCGELTILSKGLEELIVTLDVYCEELSISAVDVDGLYEVIIDFFDKILLFSVGIIFNVGRDGILLHDISSISEESEQSRKDLFTFLFGRWYSIVGCNSTLVSKVDVNSASTNFFLASL